MNDSHLGDSIFGTPGGGGGARRRWRPQQHDEVDVTAPVPPPDEPERPAASRREMSGHPQAPDPGRRAAHTSQERVDDSGRGPALRGCLALLVGALVLGAACIFAISALGSSWLPTFGTKASGPSGDYNGPGTGSVTITVDQGASGADIGLALQKAGVVKSASTFTSLAAGSPGFSALQPGSYRMRSQMSSAAALSLLLKPGTKLAGVTIPEGLWASEIYLRLSKATSTPVADYGKVASSSLGLPAAAKGRVEGYLFPSTYNFPKGATAKAQLSMMVAQFNKEVAALQIPVDRLADVTTTASLVQAEASLPADEGKVARVIDNRVAAKMPLQFDSTVNYVLRSRGKVTTSDRARESKSPYNTYKRPGLPPGPIDNPGAAAPKAALNPTPGNWIYFVTVDLASGRTIFSTTDAAHQAAVKQFRAWCTAHPGKC